MIRQFHSQLQTEQARVCESVCVCAHVYSLKNTYKMVQIGTICKQPKYLATAEWINTVWCIAMGEYYTAMKKNNMAAHKIDVYYSITKYRQKE